MSGSRRYRPLFLYWLLAAMLLLAGFSQRAALDALIQRLNRDPALVRPAMALACVLLATVVVIAAWRAVITMRTYPARYTWRMSARAVGGVMTAISAAAVAAALLISLSPPTIGPFAGLRTDSVVATVIPLLVGIQVAVLFSAQDEPALEITVASSRPFSWVVVERLAVVLTCQIAIALAGTVISGAILHKVGGGELASAVIRWLPAMVLLAGLGLRVTLSTREMVFGVCAVIGLWAATGLFGSAMLIQYPFLWPLHLFLSPEQFTVTDYLLNRTLITLLGMALLSSAITQLHSEELVLTGKNG